MPSRPPRQLDLPVPNTWGGKRAGAGRKPRPGRRCVPHFPRPSHRAAHPVHVTLRARGGLPPLRDRALLARMKDAIRAGSRSPAVGDSFRIVHFSIQNDHVHLIVEAHDADHLSRGVQGLAIRLARGINSVLGVRGKVWGDRFHARDLRTPREVRNALVYVLMNAKKHVRNAPEVDPFSSAPWFDGFLGARVMEQSAPAPVVRARTWLAGEGWRRRGRIAPRESPGSI